MRVYASPFAIGLAAASLGLGALMALPQGSAPRAAAQPEILIPPLRPVHVPRPVAEAEPPLEIQLRELDGRRVPADPQPGPAHAAPMTPAETARLLARLPPLPVAEEEAFRFPAASPRPPRTGAVVEAPFPPPDAVEPPARPDAPPSRLEVVRVSPGGETEMAPHVTVVFSEPMVPSSTVGQLDRAPVPVTLDPAPPGRWRWIDTRTLRFEPEAGRLPMASSFRLRVPADARSAAGAALGRDVVRDFATPPPTATGGFPHDEVTGLEPLFLLVFDQPVDPHAIARHAAIRIGGGRQPVRVATEREIAADTAMHLQVKAAPEGRRVVLRPVRPLPADARARLVVEPGAPSLEGPRLTEAAQYLPFRTYPPLRVERSQCGYGHRGCGPGDPWHIRFTTALDPAAWDDGLVRVEPAVEGLRVHLRGATLSLQSDTRPQTAYTVTLDPRIRDVHGQRLGRAETIRFRVGEGEPHLAITGAPFVVLDPAGGPRLQVETRGMERFVARVYRVRPEHWPAYAAAVEAQMRSRTPQPLRPPGERVDSVVVHTGEARAFAETGLDLSRVMEGGIGHAIVVVDPIGGAGSVERRRGGLHAWVQSTRIGVTAAVEGTEIHARARSLDSAEPLPGVAVRLFPAGQLATTDPHGLVRLPLPPGHTQLLTARLGGDIALLPAEVHGGRGGGWERREGTDRLAWEVFSDRGLYRPGETVSFKGWVRRITGGKGGDVELPVGIERLAFTASGPRGEEIGGGDLPLTDLGGFHETVRLPEEINLGHAGFHLRAIGRGVPQQGAEHRTGVAVQEFRRPEYEVRIDADPGPHRVGETVEMSARAAYYAGGGLPGSEIEWRVRTGPADFTPPGWEGWSFGREPRMWWGGHGGAGAGERELRGHTDEAGEHRIAVDLVRADPPFAAHLHAQVQVEDLERRAGSAHASVLVHPADAYVGLRLGRAWVAPGQPAGVEVMAVDLEGAPIVGRPVTVRAQQVEWRWEGMRGGRWEVEDDTEVCRFASTPEPTSCTVTPERPGSLRLVAEVSDGAGRVSRTERTLWVAGARMAPPAPGRDTGVEVSVVPDRERYRPGEIAEILVQAPFHPAEATLTLRRGGVVRSETFVVDGPTHTLRVPIIEEHMPAVYAHVEMVEQGRGIRQARGETRISVPPLSRELDVRIVPRDSVADPGTETAVEVEVLRADGTPAAGAEVAVWMVDEAILALGRYRMPDPLAVFHPDRGAGVRDHALQAHVVPAPVSAGPGTLSGTLRWREHGGAVAGARVGVPALGVEGVTGVAGAFTLRGVAAGRHTLRIEAPGAPPAEVEVEVAEGGTHLGTVFLGRAGVAALDEDVIAVRGGGDPITIAETTLEAAQLADLPPPPAAAPPPAPPPPPGAEAIPTRADFAPLALFEPALRTDARGRVQVPVRLPETLTRYRVAAVAVEGATRSGVGEAAVTARRDLTVRALPPRFLNFGDRTELPVLVQNLTDRPLEVEVALRATILRLEEEAGRRVRVPAGDRAEVRFPAEAVQAGTAHIQVAAASGARTDATAVSVPVYTPATAEAFATYGEIDGERPVVLPVQLPAGVIEQFGGLETTVSSTALHALTDAVLFLHAYPHEGAEQVASRILAIAALRDVLAAFEAAELPPPERIEASAIRDLRRLAEMQRPQDGGWSLWRPREEPPHPFVSVHAAHALQRAREMGLPVDGSALERSRHFLEQVERHIPPEYGPEARRSVIAYALYVRQRMGDGAAAGRAAREAAELRGLPLEAAGWLLHALAAEGRHPAVVDDLVRHLGNRATVTAATATFATAYRDGDHLLMHSDRRSDAVVLEALIAADPGSDLIPRAARGLLAHRVRGRWRTTQENSWALLALHRYFTAFERTEPDFRARVWLGERYAGGHDFRGRTTEHFHLEIPLPEVTRTAESTDLLLDRAGTGRMYYRAALRYAPADLELEAEDRGFVVERSYEAVDREEDVQWAGDGTWYIRAGARVRVRVTVTAPARRHHAALIDPLPAGLEPLNPELAGTGFTDEGVRPPRPGVLPAPVRPGPRRGGWFTHQNLRDDRAEAFATILPAGTYEYVYQARATTPGRYVVPPPRAEELYHPETFGRGATARVVVLPAETAEVPQARRDGPGR